MTVEHTNKIDAIGIDNSSEDLVLTIFDHMEWGSQEHLVALQNKLNTYLAFVESGEIYEAYPDAFGRSLRIDVRFLHPADPIGEDFLSKISSVVSQAGIQFSTRLGVSPLTH